MSNKENNREKGRKCSKCGKTAEADNVKLFRFPKPATRNLLRCTLWAKYLFPSNEQHTSIEFQRKLYNEHKVLCENHFGENDFRGSSRKLLQFTAVPYDTERVSIPTLPAYFEVPKPGCFQAAQQSTPEERIPLKEIVNTGVQIEGVNMPVLPVYQEPQPGTSQRQVNEPLMNPVAETTQGAREFQTEKERRLFEKCSRYMQNVWRLRNHIKHLKKQVVMKELTDSNAIKKLSKKITPAFALLLQGQLRNFNKKYSGRRWTKEEKILALRLFKRSPTCYRLLRRLFQLPSPSTLKALLNRVPFTVGVNQSLGVLTDYTKTQKPSDNYYILMFDEMSLKRHFNYNEKDDLLEGFQDHGTQGRSPIVAEYALVFMIAGIRKCVKQPISHYFSSGFSTADRLVVLLKEVLRKCFEAGINIAAIVCDMDGVNRRAITTLGATVDHPYFMIDDREVITLFDPPHLLKCFRNLFLKYDIQCSTNIFSGDKAGIGVAKWSHLKDFYEIDNCNPMFVFAPALTKDHLNPNAKQKMRVKLAAQVLSHTVTAGLYAKISDGTLGTEYAVTASVTAAMDKLFDSVNSDSADLRRGKLHATNMTMKSPHLELFAEMKQFFTTLKFIDCARTPPSQTGWILTMNGIERLFKKMVTSHDDIRSLATRRLQQDSLENLFGCIRGNCGSNANPTVGQFVAGLKTAIISSLAHIGTTGNCEEDNNVIINNFDTLLSDSKERPKANKETVEVEEHDFPSVPPENIDEDNADIQACAYVCGYILKKLPTCDACKEIFVSPNIEKCHIFVECREYSQFKRSLVYANKNFIACVESCASIINAFLTENGHSYNLKKTIKEKIINHVNFDFVKQCPMHGVQNLKIIIDAVFMICVRRFCVVKNRLFADEASAAALKRKMNILQHK